MKAIWNNTVIAESTDTKIVENNHYFPMSDIKEQYFKSSDTHTRCPWKGKASYFTIEVDKEKNEDAAWFYPSASKAAKPIENYVAFWKGVKVTE
ncbi:DUF427 domain-containing protein [Salegentibacter sp. F188]|uniref:DUF427 domain-containing protein n=1 Tax=Autumnicola patrickiae TaxID=3075591 RepID=A0ABU3DZQ8_9FLAO|nr:DUF427 domain-containing protein [Salegentibacter sp. F188]MDT0689193.1 DUF427 domain-containing protein [Salegentibacter sp. F188]